MISIDGFLSILMCWVFVLVFYVFVYDGFNSGW